MNSPDLPQIPREETPSLIVRWITEFRRVIVPWMRRVEQNKQIKIFGPYTVTAGDVTAGTIDFFTTLSTINAYTYRLRTAANNNAEVAWTGTVSTVDGNLTFTNAGATPFAAGQILSAIVQGE